MSEPQNKKTGERTQKPAYLPDVQRLLPQSPDAERALIGSFLLLPGEVGALVAGKIAAEDFHIPAHAIIFGLLIEFWNANRPIDLVTVTQTLIDRELLDQIGGAAFVAELFTFTPTAANASYYLEICREKRTLRRIIATCTEYAGRAYAEQENVFGLLDECQARMLEISQDTTRAESVRHASEGVMDVVETIENAYNHRGRTVGLPTGFFDYDRMTGGMHPQQMIVIAARPSMGKTALAMNIAEHVALVAKKAVLIFSLEMSFHQLVERMVCSNAPLNMQRVRDGFLAGADFPNVARAAQKIGAAPLWIDDTPGLTALDLKARARRMHRKLAASGTPLALIVIDYLQMMKSLSKRAQFNRTLEITEISAAIKETARELNLPIIVAAQLNRDSEDRKGNRPQISDLRESGAIEQDADVIGLLFREEYYKPDNEDLKGKAEWIIGKQRNGPVGPIQLLFKKQITRFENVTQKQFSNNEEERQQWGAGART